MANLLHVRFQTSGNYQVETTPEINFLLNSYKQQTQTLYCVLEQDESRKGAEIEYYVAIKVNLCLHVLREKGKISRRPIAHVIAKVPDLKLTFHLDIIKVTDLKKRDKYHSICLIRDKQLILFKNLNSAQLITLKGWVFRLLRGDNCGHIVNNRETSKTKSVGGWLTSKKVSTVAIEKYVIPKGQSTLPPFAFRMDGTNTITIETPPSSSPRHKAAEEQKAKDSGIDFEF